MDELKKKGSGGAGRPGASPVTLKEAILQLLDAC